jgi:hypothetical protein
MTNTTGIGAPMNYTKEQHEMLRELRRDAHGAIENALNVGLTDEQIAHDLADFAYEVATEIKRDRAIAADEVVYEREMDLRVDCHRDRERGIE